MPEIKFCGMTRAEDVREAGTLGARYVGVIFAESPRRLSVDAARDVLAATPKGTARAGVFGTAIAIKVSETAIRVGLDVAQLHDDPDPAAVAALRRLWDGQIWAVVRVAGDALPASTAALFDAADAVVLDARVAGRLGGTGVALPWEKLRGALAPLRSSRARLVLAGGLDPANVAQAVDALEPDVVDVSSGVEASVGVKDHARMRAFRDAVAGVRTP